MMLCQTTHVIVTVSSTANGCGSKILGSPRILTLLQGNMYIIHCMPSKVFFLTQATNLRTPWSSKVSSSMKGAELFMKWQACFAKEDFSFSAFLCPLYRGQFLFSRLLQVTSDSRGVKLKLLNPPMLQTTGCGDQAVFVCFWQSKTNQNQILWSFLL